ncbi:DUF3592 domain-containing protein [Massilia sp. TN1-12]|uniref:DUF3592 domain-containing protein n=1 Tax=Massilia paldalensis TaxID=3377675 RepID=UPI00384CB98C
MGLISISTSPRPFPAKLACLIGAFMFAVAAWQGFQRMEFLRAAETAAGQVVGVKAAGTQPQVLFHAGDMRINYLQGGMALGYAPGQAVQVRYLPERPAATAVLDDVLPLWGATGLFALLGAAAGAIGLVTLRAQRAARAKQ